MYFVQPGVVFPIEPFEDDKEAIAMAENPLNSG